MRVPILFFTLLLAILCGNAQAQTTVTGKVTDRLNGEAIVGATVKIDGTTRGTATDLDGNFTLANVPASSKKLTVTSVGYKPVTMAIAPKMEIQMEPTSEMMDEVIVVAFGKQKRESFTGSATVIKADEIANQQVTNPLEVLNGRVAGMQMTETNDFTGDPTIRVRGFSSIHASNQPLIVLDGMPYNGYYQDINPDDIESMTVLKDAASNALYGARGANGVIMITTKSAQRGKTKVNVNAKWGVNTDGRVEYDYIKNPGQYYEAYYQALRNSYQYANGMSAAQAHVKANQTLGSPASEGGLGYMVYQVPANQYLIGENGRLNPNAVLGNRQYYNGQFYTLLPDNWLKNGKRDGFRQEYNVSLTGGNDNLSVLASLGYFKNEGISKGDDIERINARIKMQYQAYKFLRVGATAGYTHSVTNTGNYVFGLPYAVGPIYPLYLRDGDGNILTDMNGRRFDYGNYDCGSLRPVEVSGNTVQENILNLNRNSSNAFNIQGFATVDFLKYFSFTANANVYITEYRAKSTANPYYGFSQSTGGALTVYHGRTTDLNLQQLLNYNQQIGEHNISALLGHEYSRTDNTYLEGNGTNFALYNSNTELAGTIVNGASNSYKDLYNVEGWFLRAQYDYAGKYFASGSFRRDGSSNFDPKHRWGNFWSVGAAWILTKEDWFPKTWAVNMLKAKLSYGEQGNDGIGSFRYTDLYNITNTNNAPAFVFSSKGNREITWESVGALNAGVEFELLNSRLRGSVEYYTRKTSDMLMWFSAPFMTGYSGYYDNVGDMKNYGLELELSGDIVATKDFRWTMGMNMTWQKNRVTYLPDGNKTYEMDGHRGYLSGDNFIAEGLSLYTWRLRKYAGVNDQGQALYYYKDADGNLQTTTHFADADYFLCGSALPTVFGGFSTDFKIKNFDISAQFNYSIGGKKFDGGYYGLMCNPTVGQTGTGLHKDVLKGWTPENTATEVPMFQLDNVEANARSDRWLINASYLSFRNLTIGYTLPDYIAKKLRMSSLRVFGTCENVAYWTKRKGFDPRMSFGYGAEGNSGDASPMRSISGGLQIQF